ncbi:MAG: hypothetical protein ACU0CI_09025 [Shimia sp.]
MKRVLGFTVMAVVLAGCAVPQLRPAASGEAAPASAITATAAPEVTANGQTRPVQRPAGLSATPATPATPASAAPPIAPTPRPTVGAAPAATGLIGATIVSLGNPAEPGLWVRTPLVDARRPGRARVPGTSDGIDVTLIPIEGADTAGSRMSLQAMQALGLDITGLPTVELLPG